jgi:drug/metabolite transporter (DMT)-like permease
MKKSGLTLKIFALIVLNDLGDTLAQIIMKKGLVATGISSVTFSNIAEFAARNASSAFVWLGTLVYLFNFFIWIVVLYKVDLSIAMPVGSSAFIFVPLAAVIFLNEQVSVIRWVGIVCIVLGIHCVSRSKSAVKKGA